MLVFLSLFSKLNIRKYPVIRRLPEWKGTGGAKKRY